MKITAFLIDFARPVGALLMSGEILAALAADGHEVTIYTDRYAEVDLWRGVRIKHRSAYKRGEPTDLVLGHPDQGSIAWLAARLSGAPYVGLVHNTGRANRQMIRQYPPDLVVWNAEATREAFAATGGLIVRSPLTVADHKAPRRGDAVTLVNLTEDKGADLFYSLAARCPDLPFLGVRGGYGQQVERPDLATLVGPVDHSLMGSSVWAKTKILLAPSLAESWGRVAAEALCTGIPVLAHPTPGLVECLGPEAGVFLDRDDVDAWEREVRRLHTDPTYYAKRSRAARARARALEAQTHHDLVALAAALPKVTRLAA